MSLTISPQIRLVALLGGIAALGLALFMFTAGRSTGSASEASVASVKPLHRVHKAPVAVHHRTVVKHATAKHTTPKRTAAPAHAAPRLRPKPLSRPTPVARKPVVAPGIPAIVARALARHPVVVVALFDPESDVDRISLAEASAGAAASSVGFVPLNVLKQAQAGPLTSTLGVLPDPAVLVYRRPSALVARFDGFADRDTVAQAAANAALVAR